MTLCSILGQSQDEEVSLPLPLPPDPLYAEKKLEKTRGAEKPFKRRPNGGVFTLATVSREVSENFKNPHFAWECESWISVVQWHLQWKMNQTILIWKNALKDYHFAVIVKIFRDSIFVTL